MQKEDGFKVRKFHIQEHSLDRDHHAQATTSRVEGVDFKTWWTGRGSHMVLGDGREMPGWFQGQSDGSDLECGRIVVSSRKPLETYRESLGNEMSWRLMKAI